LGVSLKRYSGVCEHNPTFLLPFGSFRLRRYWAA